MREARIEPKQEGKGRTFRATLLASVEADRLWEGGMSEDARPVWAMFAGSEQEMKSFVANLVGGRKVLFSDNSRSYRRKGDRMEFLRSFGYQVLWQREAEGSLVTVFLPDLFRLDPGMVDPHGAHFVIMPPKSWRAEQKIEAAPIVNHALAMYPTMDREMLERLVPLSFLFCAYLDRRTRCPLLSDGRFYLQTMLACLDRGLASWSTTDVYSHNREFGQHGHLGFMERDTDSVGFDPGIAFQAEHGNIETLLAQEVDEFFRLTGESHG